MDLRQFTQTLPQPMQPAFLQSWQRYLNSAEQVHIQFTAADPILPNLWRNLALSEYVTQIFCTFPELPLWIFEHQNLSLSPAKLKPLWSQLYSSIDSQTDLMRALRQFRHRCLCQIIWRDVLGLSSIEQHFKEISALADVCVDIATDYLYTSLANEWGRPCNDKQEPQPFIVIAVGKLGGQELNLSSDIDLIFVYPEAGMTDHEQRKIHNDQFFTRLSQQFIKVLSEITSDGFVYRVDMRLRPHGHSGNLVLNFSMLENYYQYHGREWERYALIKARTITGSPQDSQRLLALLQPFVYRRYLDYGIFQALREMKNLVINEIKRRGIEKDLKLGRGGIRQIEFFVQSFQLIRGGQKPQFQRSHLLEALSQLYQSGYIEPNVLQELRDAYIFLRRCEHRIQMIHDAQTHALPTEPLDQARLYFALGFQSWKDFQNTLTHHTANVDKHFSAISAAPQMTKLVHGKPIWSLLDQKDAHEILESLGYQDPELVLKHLLQFKHSRLFQQLKPQASARVDKVMSAFILMLAEKKQPFPLLTRMLRLMQSLMRRSAYLALLIENPQILAYLVKVCDTSEWILEQLCAYPILLDELLSPPTMEEMQRRHFLEGMLEERLSGLSSQDLEAQMDHLRQFKLTCFLYLATHEMLGNTEPVDISEIISEITEMILNKVYELSLNYLVHDQFLGSIEEIKQKIPFAIIAYGKLGAKEMSYVSDLDLVFLYEYEQEEIKLKNGRLISAAEFSLRLAQRIIHLLSTHTTCGILYEVDVRLRPDGSAGLLVSPFSAYKKYLLENAWVWEHQALVKARMVVGSVKFHRSFESCRKSILCMDRNDQILNQEISKMRDKIHDLPRHDSKQIDLKFMPGGLSDIQFLVEYLVLSGAKQHDNLCHERNTIEILQILADLQLLSPNEAHNVIQVYQQYQALLRRKLLQPEIMIEPLVLTQHAKLINKLWEKIFIRS